MKALALLLLAALAVPTGAVAVSQIECDWHSSFCAIPLPGGKSEVVVAWLDGFEVFTQQYPAE